MLAGIIADAEAFIEWGVMQGILGEFNTDAAVIRQCREAWKAGADYARRQQQAKEAAMDNDVPGAMNIDTITQHEFNAMMAACKDSRHNLPALWQAGRAYERGLAANGNDYISGGADPLGFIRWRRVSQAINAEQPHVDCGAILVAIVGRTTLVETLQRTYHGPWWDAAGEGEVSLDTYDFWTPIDGPGGLCETVPESTEEKC